MCLSILGLENYFPVCWRWASIGRDRTVEEILTKESIGLHGVLERVSYENMDYYSVRPALPDFFTCLLSLPLSAMLCYAVGAFTRFRHQALLTFQPLVL